MKYLAVTFFLIGIVHGFTAYPMKEKTLVKSGENDQVYELKKEQEKIFSVLDAWGFIKINSKAESKHILPFEQLYFLLHGSPPVKELSVLENQNLASLGDRMLQIVSLWETSGKDKLDTEDLLADLATWMQESNVFKDLKRESDGTYTIQSGELKKQFAQFRSNAFLLKFDGGACVLSRAVVSFFPYLAAKTNYTEKAVQLGGCDRETVVLFKKLLYVFYHFSIFSKAKIMKGHSDRAEENSSQRQLFEGALHEVLSSATSEQLLDFLSIAHSWDNKLIMEILLDSLKYHDYKIIKQFIKDVPLNYFVAIRELMENNDFIAHLVALKIKASCKSNEYKLTNQDKAIFNDCLESFAQYLHKLNTNIGLHQLIKLPNAASDRPFYTLLDSQTQEALKNKVISQYVVPTLMFLNIKKEPHDLVMPEAALKTVYRAESTADRTFYFFDKMGSVRAYALRKYEGLFGNFEEYFSEGEGHAVNGCLIRVSFGSNHDWIAAGETNGIIRIYATPGSKNKNQRSIRINSLPAWGLITALTAYDNVLVAAYKSGCLVLFDLKEWKALLQERKTCLAHEWIISCTPDKARYHELVGLLRESSYPGETLSFETLAMNGIYVIGASENGHLRIWRDKKLQCEILVPLQSQGSREMVLMHIFGNNGLAVGCSDGTVHLIDLNSGRIANSIKGEEDGSTSRVTALTTMGESAGYLVVAHSNGQVYIWDLESKGDEPFKVISSELPAVGVGVLPTHRNVLEIIYSNGVINYVFMPKIAQLADVIEAVKNRNIFDDIS